MCLAQRHNAVMSGLMQYTWDRPLYNLWCQVIYFLFKKIVFLSEDLFWFNKQSVDPDEMPHNAAFHLGLHCL